MKWFFTILSFLCLFGLFYFEPIEFGGITFSQLWKIPLFLYLFYILIKYKLDKPVFIKLSIVRSFKNLFNGGIITNPFVEIIDFIRYMMFPLLFNFFQLKTKNVKHVDLILVRFAQFIIISGVPFVFLGLKSQGKVLFELEDIISYTGVFQGAHAASISTATALLILMNSLRNKDFSKFFNSILIGFGIYLLFLTFVRTGYLMFLIGSFVILIPSKRSMKQFVITCIILVVGIIGIVYLLEENSFFYDRIFDIRNGRQTDIGSGRLIFWEATVSSWAQGNWIEIIFGQGLESLKENIYQATGLRIYAHNEFFTQLGQNGILGVILFIVFIWSMISYIIKRRNTSTFRLALAVFCLYFSLMLTQGGMWFQLDIFMALIFCRMQIENNEQRTKLA